MRYFLKISKYSLSLYALKIKRLKTGSSAARHNYDTYVKENQQVFREKENSTIDDERQKRTRVTVKSVI